MEKSGAKSSKPKRDKTPKGVPRGTPIPTATGGVLIAGAGRGPAKGAPNAGRPPDVWKATLRSMASRDEVLEHINAVLLAGPAHPFFPKALEYVTEHGYGRATQPITADVTVSVADVLERARKRAGR